MPGLFGLKLFNQNKNLDSTNLIAEMTNKLQHFSHYSTEGCSVDQFGIGVIDFKINKKKNIYVDVKTGISLGIYGDIYNYSNLNVESGIKDNRAKILYELYKKYNEGIAQKLNGDFNIAIFNPTEDKLTIINDRFGFRHLYYYSDNNCLLFAPEMKAFLAYPQMVKTIDEQGVGDFFNFAYHLDNRTFFKNVKLLPPASILNLRGSKISVHPYWKQKYSPKYSSKNMEECIEKGFNLFKNSVKRKINNKKSVVLPLSGGLDSRFILSIAKDHNLDIKTATFDINGGLEQRISKKIARKFGMAKPQLVTVKPEWIYEYGEELVYLNEGHYGNLGSTTLIGFKNEMGTEYDGLLNGIFGGHLTFGSPYFNYTDYKDKMSHPMLIDRISRGLNGHLFNRILSSAMEPASRESINSFNQISIEEQWQKSKQVSAEDYFRQDYIFLHNRIRRGMNNLDLNRFFYNSLLPFADYDLFDFYLNLSPELLLDHTLYKEIYKRKLPEMAKIAWSATGVNLYKNSSKLKSLVKHLNKNIQWYTTKFSYGKINFPDKSTYSNHDVFLRKSTKMQKWITDILLDKKSLDRGYFLEDGIINILNKQKRGADYFSEISKLVVFELFMRNFMDN